ncbi:DNA polymerase/3'-5' exonuclease PolX [Conexibacter sp. DBS9H8]|uniref:DNA polymerase/3'-5' exonuclease PolX n=1 Tax=Conexibacter sp. DBS9H8 TaxID=2937801 RepID=UPI00200D64B5|nr:DNA polymerase/3'-5' exonuclease PolX [Conexibacter sp. DBS9H8]
MAEPSRQDPTNAEVADALEELADLYELDGAVIHRISAYRNAAKAVRGASVSVTALARAGRATELAGVGATIQEKIRALADEGEIPARAKLTAKYPPGLVAMTRLPGLGPKRARRLFDELGIDGLPGLRTAAMEGQIQALKGFGAKAEAAILEALDAYEAEGPRRRVLLDRALAVGEELVTAIAAHPAADRVALAGSARRMTETVKDLDIVATATDPAALTRAAAALELVASASTPGENAVRLRTHSGLEVDLRIVEPDQFGNVLQHLTGSKEHNVNLREYAVRRGLHVSEYGILDDATGLTHRCATEAEVYARLGLDYIEPELREGRGEVRLAAEHRLPELVSVADLRGDLHAHTTASDGTASVAEMAAAAAAAGYEYLAITDHSASMGFGADLSASALAEHITAIRGTEVDGIELLAGSEVNILPDGSLDYPDELLAELDWVIASVHTSFALSEAAMTARIVAAIEHPYVDCIGHLSGRRLDRRPGYALDLEAVLAAAAATGTLLEINANPVRRDLSESWAAAAAAAGILIVINTDAHRTDGFDVNRYGVATARRAGLGPAEIANSRPWRQLRRELPSQRARRRVT